MPLSIAFFISLLTSLFSTALFPSFRLFAFAPFITLAFTRKNLYAALWLSLACGLLVDMQQSQYHFGFYTLLYLLTTLVLYRQKWLIFSDKPLSLSLFVAIYSFVATLLHLTLLYLFGVPTPPSSLWITLDLFLMLPLDALYALLLFTLPHMAYTHLRKKILIYRATKKT